VIVASESLDEEEKMDAGEFKDVGDDEGVERALSVASSPAW